MVDIIEHPTFLAATPDGAVYGDTGRRTVPCRFYCPFDAEKPFPVFRVARLREGGRLHMALAFEPDAETLRAYRDLGGLQPAPDWAPVEGEA
jgi:hypothetical protein